MTLMRTVISIALFIASTVGSTANYRCSIERIDFSDETDRGVREMHIKNLVGKQFAVDTTDGVMTGVLNNSLFKPPLVLNHGDSENSFVTATIVSPKFDQGVVGVDTRILTIKTWHSTRRKPFSLFWDDMLMRGACVTVK
jgi:hypothetical protein